MWPLQLKMQAIGVYLSKHRFKKDKTMKIKSIVLGCTLVAANLLILPITYAAAGDKYFGLSVGSSDADTPNETDTGIKLILGFQPSDAVALEIAYVDLGDFDTGGSGSLSISGIALNAIGKIPLNNDIAITGKLGMYTWDTDLSPGSDSGTDLAYGFGVEVKVSKEVAIVAEYEMFDVDDGDVSLISGGAKFYFY